MKIKALLLAAAAVFAVGITAVQAEPTVRDHRKTDSANCPGGVSVNGSCAQKVLRPRCQRKFCHYH